MNSARTILSNLPAPAESLAILLGFAELTIFGLAGFSDPVEFSKGYGIPIKPRAALQTHPGAITSSSDEEDSRVEAQHKIQTGYINAVAARNLQNGVVMLAFACYVRDRRALGIVTLANTITTLADAWIAVVYGVSGSAWGHGIGVFNSVAVGGALLLWRRDDPWW